MRIFCLISAAAFLNGCSALGLYLQRPNNYEALPQDLGRKDIRGPTVASLSLDASRRLVMSQRKDSDRFTCSEPPPDVGMGILAKSALEASGKGAGYEGSGKISDEFATTVVALARRSTNVELWRTTSFTYCTLMMNGWFAQADTYLSKAHDFAISTDDAVPLVEEKKEPSLEEKIAGARAAVSKAKLDVAAAQRDKGVADGRVKLVEIQADAEATKAAKIQAAQAELNLQEANFSQKEAELNLATMQGI